LLKRLVERVVMAFLSCNMTKGLIEFTCHLGFKEEGHFVAHAGGFLPASGPQDLTQGLRTNRKTIQPEFK